MRLNLTLNGTDIRAGFLNVDPFARPGDGKVLGHPGALDDLAEDAEAVEIVALDVIDHLPPGDVDGVISHWVEKLRHGGVLTVGGLDIVEVARKLAGRQIGLQEAVILIHGDQSAPWSSRKSNMTQAALAGMLAARGLKIFKQVFENNHYLVTGRRP